MPRYGHCAQCGTSVWLTESGGCPNGHGPESISGIVDQPEGPATPPMTSPAPAPKRNNTVLIVLAVVAVVVLCGCALLVAVAVPVFRASSDSAKVRVCYANQRVMEGAYQQWLASSEQNKPEDVSDYSALEAVVLGEGYMSAPVQCPTGGEYLFEGDEVTCTEHGHY